MYLVHARLRSVDEVPPSDESVLACLRWAGEHRGLEHITVHPAADERGPVLGLFLAAGSRAEAQRAARTFCLDALAHTPELSGLTLVSCAAVTPRGYYDPSVACPN